MGFKQILMIGFIFLNLVIHFLIIAIIGFKNFFLFTMFFLISIIVTTIILGFMGKLDADKWKIPLRIKWYRIGILCVVALLGILSAYFTPRISGIITGFILVLSLIFFCNDFMAIVINYMDLIKNILNDKVESKLGRWFK